MKEDLKQDMKRMNEMCKLGTIEESWCVNLGRATGKSAGSAMRRLWKEVGTGALAMRRIRGEVDTGTLDMRRLRNEVSRVIAMQRLWEEVGTGALDIRTLWREVGTGMIAMW